MRINIKHINRILKLTNTLRQARVNPFIVSRSTKIAATKDNKALKLQNM